jgi:hypothetical protein
MVFSGTGSETLISKRSSGPDGQHNLRNKRATDEHKEGAPRGLYASVFMECEKVDEFQSLPIEIRTSIGRSGHRIHAVNNDSLQNRVEYNLLPC